MNVLAEMRRLLAGPSDDDGAPLPARYEFSADDPGAVIERARSVLAIVFARCAQQWPSTAEWHSLLPQWFVDACAPTPSDHERWSLDGWLYWFDPAGDGPDRTWEWWDAGIVDGRGWVEVAIDGFPFGSGPMRWLLVAAGGGDAELTV